jgi:hypothetical protein
MSNTDAELVLFTKAARRVGISPPAATRLAELGEFLRPVWVGDRRYLFRDEFEAWLQAKRAEARNANYGDAARI